jgi:hypothetical protein
MMSTNQQFSPANPIEARIVAGDFDGVVGAIRAMCVAERTASAASLRTLLRNLEAARWDSPDEVARRWGSAPINEQCDAARAALFFCGADAERVDAWPYTDAVFDHLDLLAPSSLKPLANELARLRPGWIHVVQRLVTGGWSDRPVCDEYIMGLMTATRNSRFGESPLLSMIDADPGLLDGPVLRLFEVEGNGEMNMAGVEKYTFTFENGWTFALLALIDRGSFTRAQLLDRTLSTLEKDWPQFRAGWFSRFHDKLAPRPEEMAPHCVRYAALCHSRIPPTVTLAVAALGALFRQGAVTGAMVLDALAPVMSSAVKSQVDSALKLIDAVLKRHPDSMATAAALLVPGLVHESADLQKKIIARLASWDVDREVRDAAARMLPHVAASNRAALAQFAGQAAPVNAAPVQGPRSVAAQLISPADPSRELVAFNDIGALMQAVVMVLEDDSDTDLFECALDGLARSVPLAPDAIARFGPAVKRAGRRIERPLSAALARFLLFAVCAEDGQAPDPANSVKGELSRRAADLIDFARQGSGLSALSTPTHRRGVIDPNVMVRRVAAHQQAGARSTLEEQVRALLRLPGGDWPAAREQARALAPSDFRDALCYALGDDVRAGSNRALFAAAARIRHPRQDDESLLKAYGEMGPDGPAIARYSWSARMREPGAFPFCDPLFAVSPAPCESDQAFIAVRRHLAAQGRNYYSGYWMGSASLLAYGASIMPSNLDAFFANGAVEICINRDWWEARWQDKTYLALLIDPSVEMTPVAVRLLACALGGKEPGQTMLAVDAFAAATVEGRLAVAPLGEYIRELLETKAGLAARYAKSLGAAARAHPAMPATVIETLCALVRFGAAAPPKDTGALLELLLELALGNGLPLPPAAVDSIGRLALTGKGKAAQRELMAVFGT